MVIARQCEGCASGFAFGRACVCAAIFENDKHLS